MLTLTDVNVGDILVANKSPYSNNFFFYQIVRHNKSGTPRYVHLHASKKVSGGQIVYRVKTTQDSKPITFTKPWKDGFLRIDGILVERYDPTRVFSLPWCPVGSEDESDYSSYVDSDFEDD